MKRMGPETRGRLGGNLVEGGGGEDEDKWELKTSCS